MLKSSSKIKKSRDGSIVCEVKEHYLRKEIPCGFKGCPTCREYPNFDILDPTNKRISTIFKKSHVLIPDSTVLLNQPDLFENDLITNVIILKSVLNKVKETSMGIFRRIESILRINEKAFYLFNNDFHIETFLTKQKDETEPDWRNRLFLNAVNWYQTHIKVNFPKISIVALFNHNNSINYVISSSIHDYINSLTCCDELVDILVVNESTDFLPVFKSIESSICFDEHIPVYHLNMGIKSGKYLLGVYYQNSDDFTSGTVLLKPTDDIVRVVGLQHINRAFNGDMVAVENVREICTQNNELRIDDGTSVSILFSDTKIPAVERCVKIVGIVRRNWKQYCGVVVRNIVENLFLFRPMDSRIPLILFESKRGEILSRSKICLAVDQWPKNLRYPRGHYIKTIGDLGNLTTETESILFERRIPYSKFSKSVLECLPSIGAVNLINAPEWRVDFVLKSQPERVDLRHLNICSIDPPGCTDIDDALHIRVVDSVNGVEIYEIGVHIADVSDFVLPGTAIDKEAYRRGTTVYLVDKRVDMLPELLSSNLCSLRSNENRLAFSVMCYIDSNGVLCEDRDVKFIKSVIRSRHAFTYFEAQSMIDDISDVSTTAVMLRKLLDVTRKLRARRLQNGALQLDSTELQSELDSETNDPIGFRLKESVDTNKLVEECMLLANILVAKRIYKSYPTISLLRCHPEPDISKLNELYTVLNSRFGFNETPATCSLARYLEKFTNPDDPFVNKIVRLMSILCLRQAIYICAGKYSYENFRHFGLAEDIYTHFTSPIRRYPDIIVHRLLAGSIGSSNCQLSLLYNTDHVNQMCEHLNRRHTAARLAGRESTKLFLYTYLKNLPPGDIKPTRGYITKILTNALVIYVPEHHHLGFLKFDPSACKKLGTTLNFDVGRIENRESSIRISLFEYVTVKITINPELSSADGLNMAIIEPLIPGISHI